MEKYDVAIIGGGTAGLAALKQLSNLGKQAILIEAGSKIGSKNLSGGILYSKKPKKGQVTNVEQVYENFLDDAPIERKITSLMFCSGSSFIPRPKLTIVLGVSKSTTLFIIWRLNTLTLRSSSSMVGVNSIIFPSRRESGFNDSKTPGIMLQDCG